MVLREEVVMVVTREGNSEGQNLRRIVNTRQKSLCMEKGITLFYTWLSLRLKRVSFVFIYDKYPPPGFLVHLKYYFVCCHFVTGEVRIVKVFK